MLFFLCLFADVHFQYNGVMIGLLLLSMALLMRVHFLSLRLSLSLSLSLFLPSSLSLSLNVFCVLRRADLQERVIAGSFAFAVLLNMKHLFIYVAPAFLCLFCGGLFQRPFGWYFCAHLRSPLLFNDAGLFRQIERLQFTNLSR